MYKLPKIEKKKNLNFKLEKSLNDNEPIYNEYICNILSKAKNKIDNNIEWDAAKKLSNEYELIHIPSKKNRNNSIAKYNPLSRSYFKMWEILSEFNLICDEVKKNIACIAEGPGGFMEALINYRKTKNIINDNIFGITLKSVKNEIPGWKKAKDFINKNKNINISYGFDNTGNIYNVNNIINFQQLVGYNNVDLITADGGFDFSIDFNKQEQLSYRIIFCEIVTALSIQKKNGTFICKIFDIYTNITVKLINLICHYYDNVYIYKPNTSRQANSEKYIIAKNFIGISNNELKKLYNLIYEWDKKKENEYVTDIYTDHANDELLKSIIQYNEDNSCKQLKSIINTLCILKNNNNINNNLIINKQIDKAVGWCIKYNIDINTDSIYLNKNKYNNIDNIDNINECIEL